MKRILLACVACAALVPAAPAQELPKLSQFLSTCYRDTTICRAKLRDYITAADQQKSICRPADQSIGEASSDLLSWLRSDDKHDASLYDQPYDDALWAAASTLWPCKAADSVPAPSEQAPAPAAPPNG